MCMFSGCPLWATILVLICIVGLIFAIPLIDWIKRKRHRLEFSKRRFTRYDGLMATDITLKNRGKCTVFIREVGTVIGSKKQPVEANLAIEIQPGDAFCISYLNAADNWYILVEYQSGKTKELKS